MHGVVYSKNINVANNTKAIFKDIVNSSAGMVINAGTHIIFDGANARSEAAITANAANNGIVEYNNNTTISKAVGTVVAPVNAIRFTGTKMLHK